MIEREVAPQLVRLFAQHPFVTVTGPRQAGKTTLCRALFPDLGYADFDDPEVRESFSQNPRAFLSTFPAGAVLDEVHRVPELLSYLKVLGDETRRNSLFVLTGSEQFGLVDAVSESLAGRTALLRLLPLSLSERRRAGAGEDLDEVLYAGGYPRIYDQRLNPTQALGDYFETYVERDARRMTPIADLRAFDRFVRLCATRIGQTVDTVTLSRDAGITRATVEDWLTLLERSDIVFRLPPYHINIRKSLTKNPKIYFHDVGLAAYLAGIEESADVATDRLRGPLFENLIVSEALKHRFNRGRRSNLSFYRDTDGVECDLIYKRGDRSTAIEIKSGTTVASAWVRRLNTIAEQAPQITHTAVVYGGTAGQEKGGTAVVPWTGVGDFLGTLDSGPYVTPTRDLGRAAKGITLGY